jgi:hypothetical protein
MLGACAARQGWLGVHPEVSIFTEELRYWDTVHEMPTSMKAYMRQGFCVEDQELDAGASTPLCTHRTSTPQALTAADGGPTGKRLVGACGSDAGGHGGVSPRRHE